MIEGLLVDGEMTDDLELVVVARGLFEDLHHMVEETAEAQEASDGALWWLTEEEKRQAEAEARAELRRRQQKGLSPGGEGEIGCHWPAATWQDIARAQNPREHDEIEVIDLWGQEF